MDQYVEIRLLPDPEFPSTVLMNVLFSKLHRGLVDQASTGIGVSFPGLSSESLGLGERLRLHGSSNDLEQLMAASWLTGMTDYIQVSGPQHIPQPAGYRVVRRVQAKSSPERLRRRLMKRKGLDEQAARQAISDQKAQRLDLPYLTLKSQSTGQTFRLFIEHRPLAKTPVAGQFSQYGLSPTATVPWF